MSTKVSFLRLWLAPILSMYMKCVVGGNAMLGHFMQELSPGVCASLSTVGFGDRPHMHTQSHTPHDTTYHVPWPSDWPLMPKNDFVYCAVQLLGETDLILRYSWVSPLFKLARSKPKPHLWVNYSQHAQHCTHTMPVPSASHRKLAETAMVQVLTCRCGNDVFLELAAA